MAEQTVVQKVALSAAWKVATTVVLMVDQLAVYLADLKVG